MSRPQQQIKQSEQYKQRCSKLLATRSYCVYLSALILQIVVTHGRMCIGEGMIQFPVEPLERTIGPTDQQFLSMRIEQRVKNN